MATAARRVVQTLSAPLCKSAPHRCAPRLTNTIPTHSHQTRAFAASRSAAAAPTVSRTRYSFKKEEFTLAEIPQNAFDRAIDYYHYDDPHPPSDLYTRISSAKCYGVVQRAEAAIRGGASPYSLSFSDVEDISAETMHLVACIMFYITSPDAGRIFAAALWASASAKGLRHATLSLAKYLVHFRIYGMVAGLNASEARFKRLVASGNDADAMAVEGHLLHQQKRYEAAKTVLERALEIGGHPTWRNYCELRLGTTYAALNRDNDARRILEKLADMGLPDAEPPLAELYLKRRWEGWELRTYRAANRMAPKLFAYLSEEEMKKHEDEDGERTSEERLLWSIEWSRLSERPRMSD
ncbi:hypothetical protein E4U22_004202 [Claviceps purpurea]|nr:hypothetical protein E4U12_003037 [Claviceps purpurea]KAG6148209.1 hypothetical protein E4U37_007551 [Claviceps purpurea]KAG6253418.1 hypothetical protein E4U24_008269 [Claviceps purpurea]KAG6324008.1 hypothetical protein E4U22_004202 [Claviceps purpurea]